jgi:hypothetical protein
MTALLQARDFLKAKPLWAKQLKIRMTGKVITAVKLFRELRLRSDASSRIWRLYF